MPGWSYTVTPSEGHRTDWEEETPHPHVCRQKWCKCGSHVREKEKHRKTFSRPVTPSHRAPEALPSQRQKLRIAKTFYFLLLPSTRRLILLEFCYMRHFIKTQVVTNYKFPQAHSAFYAHYIFSVMVEKPCKYYNFNFIDEKNEIQRC